MSENKHDILICMNIGIDARFWNETGVGRYTRNLVTELQLIDNKNTYILFSISKNISGIQKSLHNKNFSVKKADMRWHTIREQIAFPKLLEKESLDLIHFPYFSVPILYNKPYVITIHDLILHHFPTGEASTLPSPIYKLKHAAYKMIIEKAAKNAQKIIAVSDATKREIIDHLHVPENKIVVIYEGIDQGLIATAKSSSSKSNYILHVGNMYPHKNMDRVLDALEICQKKKIDIQLIIVGREDFFYQRFHSKVLNRNLEKAVVFKGEVSDSVLANLYQSCLATIVPSLMEGFGLPALEAMANRCLVLCSQIPSLIEVCGDAPLYFEPLDAQSIASQIENALTITNERRKAKVEIGYNRSKKFSWSEMGKDTHKVYESCASLRQS